MPSLDSLITNVIPTTDSLKVGIMDSLNWYKISAFCNVEGDSWWIQLLTAAIGAAAGGLFAGGVTWWMGRKQAEGQLLREKARDALLQNFEEKRATLQRELEDHRDKRQNTWMLLQTLQEFANHILEADKYAAINLAEQMKFPGARESILLWGELVEKIEFLWQQKGFLLDGNVSQSIKKIHDWMFDYKLQAMQSTMCAPNPSQLITTVVQVQQKRVDSCVKQCQELRALWNAEWNQLNSKMKQMRQFLL